MSERAGGCGFVFVDGIDGSGKSTLARALCGQLQRAGTPAFVLAVDDFRQPVDWSKPDDEETNIYYERYFDLASLDRCCEALAQGAQHVQLPTFHEGKAVETRIVPVPAASLVVVEGVFTQRLKMASHAALIYVDVPWEEARRRILIRDQARGRTLDDVTHRIEARYFPAQRRYLEACAPTSRAHWVLSPTARGGFAVRGEPDRSQPVPLAPPHRMALQAALAATVRPASS